MNNFVTDRVYHPGRILRPLRRLGPKGAGKFVDVGWAEALDDIAGRIANQVAEYGGSAVLPYSFLGTQGLVQGSAVSDPFFQRIGATRLERSICGATGIAGIEAVNGPGIGLLPEELQHSSLVLLWGTNTINTNLHLWPFIRRAREAGARVVVVDPIVTRTAKSADLHIQIAPATDAVLALGLVHVVLRDGLVDQRFVDSHTTGFDQLRSVAASYPPDRVASITGVDANVIEVLGHEYGTTRAPAIRVLVGMEHRRRGSAAYQVLATLPALVGAWRRPGGGLVHMTTGLFDALDPTCGLGPIAASASRSVNMAQIGQALTEADPPVRSLVVYNANPAVTAPNQRKVIAGLEREDLFTVVIEHVMTDTARHADYVLPATTQVEHLDVVPSWGHSYLTWNDPAVAPVAQCLPNSEIFRRLAHRLGFNDDVFRSSDEKLALGAVSPLGAERVNELRSRGWIRMDTEQHRLPYADGEFATSDGRAHLAIDDPIDALELAQDHCFPLRLISSKSSPQLLNSGYSWAGRAKSTPAGGPFVRIHPDDANSRALSDGSMARVSSAQGFLDLPVMVSDEVGRGWVCIPSGWPSDSEGMRSANMLTTDGLSDRGGGGDFHDTRVQVALVPSPHSPHR